MDMARTRTSCLLVCLLAVLTRGVTAIDCAPQCRCYGTTVDCSHGALTGFPRNQLIPTSTEVILLNDNQLSEVSRNPQLPNLLELSLEDNSITALTRNPFIYRPNLQILRLGGNAISNLPASAFNGLSQLVRLYLNRNTITTITAFGSNSVVNGLKMLDLQDNKLTSIGIGTFTGVSLLTELNLSSNNISAIEDGSFSHLKGLRVLYLHSNHIGMLNSATYVGMSALTRLTLSNNKIQSLPDMAFIGAPNLEFLDLSLNDLSTITQEAFSGLYNLTTLLLGNNKISSIEDWAFGDLVKLQSLVLINNFLQNISAATFTSTELWDLDLANNGLTTIRRGDFARLTKLKYLRIYGNDIANVEDFSFENLANLKVLEIFGNRLTNVSAATFKGLVSVEHIGMGGQPIESFPDDTFWDLPKLAHLGLRGNPLVSASDAVFSPLQSLKSIALSNTRLSSLPALPVSLESLDINNDQLLTELRPGDFTTLPRSETGDHLPLPNLTSLVLSNSGLQKIHPFAFATLPALTSLNLYRNDFQSVSSLDPDAFGNLTTLLSLNIDGVTTLSPRVFRHLPCLQAVTLGEKFTCNCDLLDLANWIKQTAVKVNPSPPTCFFPRPLRDRSLETLREEDFGTCPATTVPPATEPTLQICPTPSPSPSMTTAQGTPPVAPPDSSEPPMSSPTSGQAETCIGPSQVTVENVQDSSAEVEWVHGGSTDLTGFEIQYKTVGKKSWIPTQRIHSTSRSFSITDLLPDTSYIACVAVFCNGVKFMEPPVDDCEIFTTGRTESNTQAPVGSVGKGMPQSAVVGLAVGVPLFLIILAMTAGLCFLRRKGRSSAEHVGQTQQQEAPIGLAEVSTDDPPYNSINEGRRPSQENPYQDPDTLTEPGTGRITSSYLQFSGVKGSMNSPGDVHKDHKGSSMPGRRPTDNIYAKAKDVDGYPEQEQNDSPNGSNYYINIIG
ncbi:uncharacterized protein LOC144910704 isoform X1 [Branchiostoma floridae x Branchiostoma belcheri]